MSDSLGEQGHASQLFEVRVADEQSGALVLAVAVVVAARTPGMADPG